MACRFLTDYTPAALSTLRTYQVDLSLPTLPVFLKPRSTPSSAKSSEAAVAWGGVAADEGGGQAEGQELHWGRHQPLGPGVSASKAQAASSMVRF